MTISNEQFRPVYKKAFDNNMYLDGDMVKVNEPCLALEMMQEGYNLAKLESQKEIIEKCAQVVENTFDKNSPNWIIGHAFAEQIRLLKE